MEIIKSKSGIIVKCPSVSTGIVKISLKSAEELNVYYANKINIEHLKQTGNFIDDSGVIYNKKGNRIEEIINIMPGESYFVIINNTENDSEFSFEIKIASYRPTEIIGPSGTSDSCATSPLMTGYGSTGYYK